MKKYNDRLEMEKQDREFAREQYKDQVEMEKARLDVERETSLAALDAAKEVAKAYYANQPEVHYTQIVK